MLPRCEETINQALSQGRAYNYVSMSGDPRYYILEELVWGKGGWGKRGAGIPSINTREQRTDRNPDGSRHQVLAAARILGPTLTALL